VGSGDDRSNRSWKSEYFQLLCFWRITVQAFFKARILEKKRKWPRKATGNTPLVYNMHFNKIKDLINPSYRMNKPTPFDEQTKEWIMVNFQKETRREFL